MTTDEQFEVIRKAHASIDAARAESERTTAQYRAICECASVVSMVSGIMMGNLVLSAFYRALNQTEAKPSHSKTFAAELPDPDG